MTTVLRAHLLRDLDDRESVQLSSFLDRDRVVLTTGPIVPPADTADSSIHVLIAGRPSEDDLLACGPDLAHLIIPWAGLPEVTRDLLRKFPNLTVHNLHHNAVPTAEMAVTLYLAAAKRLVPLDQALRRGDWSPRYEPRNETVLVEGKSALIFGYGAIGQHIAQLIQAFGMTVEAVSRTGSRREDDLAPSVSIHEPDALPDLLPATDALFICAPLTEETRGIVGAKEIGLLPSRAIIVNVARGPVIDEQALFEALSFKRILGAGLDVWYQYPGDESERAHTYPSQFPFHELENVVLSPHRAGAVGAVEAEQRRWRALADLLNAAVADRPMPNQVDLDLGY